MNSRPKTQADIYNRIEKLERENRLMKQIVAWRIHNSCHRRALWIRSRRATGKGKWTGPLRQGEWKAAKRPIW